MGIKRIIKKVLTKVEGTVRHSELQKRSYGFCDEKMTLNEADSILRRCYSINNEESCFYGLTSTSDEVSYDLSIVIPVYNGEKYLSECLDSILSQNTDYSYEVICVDDESTDSSPIILQKYASDSRIKVIRQRNKGISGARNRGIQESKGRYLMLVDNDDILAAGMLQTLMKEAIAHEADIVKCGHRILAPKREIDVIDTPYFVSSDQGLQENLTKYNGFIWGTLLKRSLFQKICFAEGFWYEDMITRLLVYRSCGKFVYVDQPLYQYRMHGNNACVKVWTAKNYKVLDQYYLFQEIMLYSDQIGLGTDTSVLSVCLQEAGKFLYERTGSLEEQVRKAAVMKAADLIRRIGTKNITCSLDDRDAMLFRSLINNNYELWQTICRLYY